MLNNDRRLVAAQRMVAVATGDEYGDGEIVTDLGIGTPYGDDVFVLGDWNGEIGSRLLEALERIGVECLWSDEYISCGDCGKLLRSEPDSYSWQPDYLWGEGLDEPVCLDCVRERYMIEDFYSHYEGNPFVNNERNALNFTGAEEWLTAQGFEPEEDWDETDREYSNGWHPGQDDTPGPVLERLLAEDDRREVVFVISEVSQFYMRFKAYVRVPEEV